MIEKALRYIVGMRKPEIMNIGGDTYSDKELHRISFNPKAKPIQMTTLTSFVEYLKANVDWMNEKMLVHVESPTKVCLLSQLDIERKRECLVEISAQLPNFQYDTYYGHESFLIALQSKFIANDDQKLLLKFAGTVEAGTVAGYGDDGVSQKATIKSGVASKTDAIVPNPVTLRPYRTFIEVEQPESKFVFRMKEGSSGGVQCALFEADGGAWKNAAMKNVKEYLAYELADMEQFTVIS